MSFIIDKCDGQSSLSNKRLYFTSKRIFDIFFSLACIPIFLVLCVTIFIANPFWNPGPLFFKQKRRGKNGEQFYIYKFRSMASIKVRTRGADDPFEEERVTPLGRLLRKSQMDELPQIINVFLGDMSVIGPRPEIEDFAEEYSKVIPYYSVRESIRPGITGHAQVTQGYTDSIEMIHRKTDLDRHYVNNIGWQLDIVILIRTVFITYAFVRR